MIRSTMIFSVSVVPKSSRSKIARDGATLKVHLTKPARDGLANDQLIDDLAEYFNVKRYDIRIVKGAVSRNKIVEVRGV
jgi:uncharacterized protein (TIGR00251 family)